MADLRFSIAVPVRSGVDWLETNLDSLARQGAGVAVALLDASADPRVPDLARRHSDLISYSYHRSSDGGQAAAIREGWEAVDGDILGWLNADDHLLPGALASVRRCFAADPSVGVVYGQAAYVSGDGAFLGYFPAYGPADLLGRANVICQPAAFVRRSAVDRVGGLDCDRHYTMDWDLWQRLFRAGCRFRSVDSVLAVVVNHAGTKTNSGSPRRTREIEELLAREGLSPWQRLRTRLGIRMGDRLTSGRLRDGGALGALWAAFRILRGGRPSFRGLELGSNRVVGGEARLVLPVPSGADGLIVHVDRPLDMVVRIDGASPLSSAMHRMEVVNAFGGNVKGISHVFSVPLAGPAHELCITAPGPWRLLAVSCSKGMPPCVSG
ncbi:glycosyltransferase [Paramagnetospirillum magneticum]|uniref:Glycosyltransferase n=1 Tax=Paramagnetospirillum magneticum (strain ATCC 700264 / AMB-1) TaxID=342108 RepID=Q2W8E1_PARM1|nr:glycosyltransferase [Paramagnetospirillum magneticum]BAE49884.1 Glycosyltransferase [Paramagnetospirillum magneticum AMB-1]